MAIKSSPGYRWTPSHAILAALATAGGVIKDSGAAVRLPGRTGLLAILPIVQTCSNLGMKGTDTNFGGMLRF